MVPSFNPISKGFANIRVTFPYLFLGEWGDGLLFFRPTNSAVAMIVLRSCAPNHPGGGGMMQFKSASPLVLRFAGGCRAQVSF